MKTPDQEIGRGDQNQGLQFLFRGSVLGNIKLLRGNPAGAMVRPPILGLPLRVAHDAPRQQRLDSGGAARYFFAADVDRLPLGLREAKGRIGSAAILPAARSLSHLALTAALARSTRSDRLSFPEAFLPPSDPHSANRCLVLLTILSDSIRHTKPRER